MNAVSALLSDNELLARYAHVQCEESFSVFVGRHQSDVRATAYRKLGDLGLAEDVAQRTFMILLVEVETAGIPRRLNGWLHKVAQLECQNVRRSVQRHRRKLREYCSEQECHCLAWRPESPASTVGEAVRSLPDRDREVLRLRFFEDKSYQDMASVLGKSEVACRKQTSRALLRLRQLIVGGGLLTTVNAMTLGKTSVAVVVALVAAVPIGWQWKNNRSLQIELEQLRSERPIVSLEPGGAETRFERSGSVSDPDLFPFEDAKASFSDKFQPSSWRRVDEVPTDLPPYPMKAEEVDAFLQLPVDEQARALAWFKMNGGPESFEREDRAVLRDVVKTELRPKLDILESDPSRIAVFQSRYVSELLGTLNQETVGKIESIVSEVYQRALAQGLDANSRPSDETLYEAWVTKRDALDRPATKAVQALLPPNLRAQFNLSFIGIMGIDLGVGDGLWDRFMEGNAIVFPSEEE